MSYKGFLMKKILIVLSILFLSACANVSKRIDVIHPNEYGISEELDGKIFSINCYGNGYADSMYVDDKCKSYMAEFAYKKGYELFSVLGQESFSDTSLMKHKDVRPETRGGYSTDTQFYNVTTHSKIYVFVLISEKEKNKLQNYYKVSDYYNPAEN